MLLKPGKGEEILIGPAKTVVKTPAGATDLFIGEHTLPPDFPGPGQHKHPEMAHAFYVLEGRVRFSLDYVETIGEAGTFFYVPANTIHTFGGAGDTAARLLEINVPGGFDRYYAELGRTLTPGIAIDMQLLLELQRRHGIVPV